MTTELEKQFFDTFGIEAKYKCTRDGNCYFQECSKCGWYIRTYPQITDHILLELICILNPYAYPSGKNIQHLKEGILEWCIKFKNDIKHQVQAIFEV